MTTGEGWNDAFLDSMRAEGDPLADTVIEDLFAHREVAEVNALMRSLVHNDGIPPDTLPPEVASYLAQSAQLGPLDDETVARAQRFFQAMGPEIMLVLGFCSLPAAYASRKGVQVLARTAYLTKRPVRRLIETAQLAMDLFSPDGLAPTGRGIRTAQKVRLMHAAVRYVILHDTRTPWDASWGVPICQEDMAGTLLTFGPVVVKGLARLGYDVPDDDADAFVRTWSAVGNVLGVREALRPTGVGDAWLLAQKIHRRQVGACEEGRSMTAALIEAAARELPRPLHGLPASLVRHFLQVDPITGEDTASLLGVAPADWTRWLVDAGQTANRLLSDVDRALPEALGIQRLAGMAMLDMMVRYERGGERAPFFIPDHLRQAWRCQDPSSPDRWSEPTWSGEAP